MVRFASATALTLAAALPVVSPALAADFAAPEGCEVFLTVQSKACMMSNLYRCDVAPKGSLWEAVFDAEGLSSVTAYDQTYQWIDSHYMWDQSREVFSPPADDPINIDDLLSEGVDTFHFSLHRTAPGENRDITVIGADVLTDETVEIDGMPLAVVNTDIQIIADDGTIEYQARGQQYLSREMRLFFLGVEDVIEADGSVTPYDNSPVDFIHPGEPGFGQNMPLYECNETKAAFEVRK